VLFGLVEAIRFNQQKAEQVLGLCILFPRKDVPQQRFCAYVVLAFHEQCRGGKVC
jgi:hypothetical protein